MVDNKNKKSLIRHMHKHISLMKITKIILLLHTCIILVILICDIFFRICHFGSFPIPVL